MPMFSPRQMWKLVDVSDVKEKGLYLVECYLRVTQYVTGQLFLLCFLYVTQRCGQSPPEVPDDCWSPQFQKFVLKFPQMGLDVLKEKKISLLNIQFYVQVYSNRRRKESRLFQITLIQCQGSN